MSRATSAASSFQSTMSDAIRPQRIAITRRRRGGVFEPGTSARARSCATASRLMRRPCASRGTARARSRRESWRRSSLPSSAMTRMSASVAAARRSCRVALALERPPASCERRSARASISSATFSGVVPARHVRPAIAATYAGIGMLSVPGMHGLVDEGFDAVESARGFRGAGTAAAALDVPLEIEVRPVKAGDEWIDHRGVLPGAPAAVRRRCPESAGRRARRCARCRASGRSPAGPTSRKCSQCLSTSSWRGERRIARQELPPPHPHVGADVVALRISRVECSSRTRARNPARPSDTAARRRCAASRASSASPSDSR